MAATRGRTIDDAGYVKLGPPPKMQPKHLGGCVECGAVFEGFDSAPRGVERMYAAGWRFRTDSQRTGNVCPAHVQDGDW